MNDGIDRGKRCTCGEPLLKAALQPGYLCSQGHYWEEQVVSSRITRRVMVHLPGQDVER